MNLARIKLLAFVLHALCVVHTVSLHKIASAMPTSVERDSNLRRLQRFLAGYALNLDIIAKVIFALLPVLLKGEYIYIAGAMLKNSDGVPELQILICYSHPEVAVATYKQRWQIETYFRAIKSSGFNIEDTHLRDIERIAHLTAMVCVALVWAYLVGEHKDMNVKSIRILKHGKIPKSLVNNGLEEIANVLLKTLYKQKLDIFKFLS